LFPLPPPGTFCGVPSLVSNGENYWLIKEREEKIRQITDNLPDFGGCKDHLFEMENCYRGVSIKQGVYWSNRSYGR
jgi:hypothetical protein